MTDFAIILDMDGLMVDSEPLSRRAWAQVLDAHGYTLNDAIYNSIIGYRIDESAAMLSEAYDLSLGVDTLAREKTNALAKIRANGVPVMPGLYEFHESITGRGLLWGVATSSSRSHAEEILEQLGLIDSCQAIAGGDEVPQGKPAPDIYLLVVQRLGVPASHCLAIEDSAPGCRSALSAGLTVVAVPNMDTKTTDFPDVDYVFPSLHEVSKELDTLLAELARH